ncbi:hypothetical protein P879_04269, partial [Paragonimus westermani]
LTRNSVTTSRGRFKALHRQLCHLFGSPCYLNGFRGIGFLAHNQLKLGKYAVECTPANWLSVYEVNRSVHTHPNPTHLHGDSNGFKKVPASDSNKINHTSPEEWDPIYRLTAMPYIQAISRLKLAVTCWLVLGSPVVLVAGHFDYVSQAFIYIFAGSAAFSMCSLAAFSYFSTKLIGVVSVHRSSGLIRLGHLNFWGRRANTMVHLENIIPPTDFADNPEGNQTVRVGILSGVSSGSEQSNRIERAFFLTRLRAEIVDREQFSKILGFSWT